MTRRRRRPSGLFQVNFKLAAIAMHRPLEFLSVRGRLCGPQTPHWSPFPELRGRLKNRRVRARARDLVDRRGGAGRPGRLPRRSGRLRVAVSELRRRSRIADPRRHVEPVAGLPEVAAAAPSYAT